MVVIRVPMKVATRPRNSSNFLVRVTNLATQRCRLTSAHPEERGDLHDENMHPSITRAPHNRLALPLLSVDVTLLLHAHVPISPS